MPPAAGEQTVTTLFADVHYCLTPPSHRPRQSRFEKSSYVYLYTTPSLSARLEVANNPGTQHQDAFTGSLTHTSIEHERRHPDLVTLEVMRRVNGDSMWQLRNVEGSGRMDLVHAIDLYFWTAQDADSFVQACQKLTVGELNIDGQRKESRAHAGEHRDNMSSVVQKLEQAAISNPQPTHARQHDSISTINSGILSSQSQTPGFPPPPPPPTAHQGSNQPTPQPLAYNPAAPPAPEPIAHREKTPPPMDAGQGTGLSAAAYHDQNTPPSQGYPYNNQGPPQPQQYPSYNATQPQQQYHTPQSQPQNQSTTPAFSPPPSLQHTTSFPPPPPSSHQTPPNHASAYPSPPSSQPPHHQTPQPPPSHSQSHTPSFSTQPQSPGFPPPQQRTNSLPFQQYASPPTSPGHPPPHGTVPAAYQPSLGSPALNSGNPTHPSNPTHGNYGFPPTLQPQPQYAGLQPQQGGHGSTPASPGFPPGSPGQVSSAQSIHSQLYTPNETDLAGRPAANTGSGGQTPGKLEGRADRLEKGVNRFLKRLDKHL